MTTLGTLDLEIRGKGVGTLDKIDKKLSRIGRNSSAATGQVGGLTKGIVGFASAYVSLKSIQAFTAITNEAQQLINQLKSVTTSTKHTEEVYQKLLVTSNKTGTSISGNADAFARISRASGRSSDDVAEFVDNIAQIGIIGGSSTQELSSAITQIGQGLASGRLQGDELRSVLENMPLAAKAIADELGVGVGALRDMGADGKITSDVVFGAILNKTKEINKEFGTFERTIGQSTQTLNNEMVNLAKVINEEFGVGGAIASTISGLATLIRKLSEGLKTYAAEKNKVGSKLGGSEGQLGSRLGGGNSDSVDEELLRRAGASNASYTGSGSGVEALAPAGATGGLATPEMPETSDADSSGALGAYSSFVPSEETIEEQAVLASAAIEDWYQIELENRQGHNERLVQLEKQRADKEGKVDEELAMRKKALRVSQAKQMIGQLGALGDAVRDQGRSGFEFAKGVNIAEAVMNTYVGATKAIAQGGIFGAALAAIVIATGLAQVAQISSQQPPARQFGGDVLGGRPYQVGEAGPEIFTAGSKQYMIPSASGRVSPSAGGNSLQVEVLSGGQRMMVKKNMKGNMLQLLLADEDTRDAITDLVETRTMRAEVYSG